MIKYIFFDLFGTILDVSNIDLKPYVKQLSDPVWKPLDLPFQWRYLRPFQDVYDSFDRLREKGYTLISLSNCPIWLQTQICQRREFVFDAAVALEAIKKYKPNIECYKHALELFRIDNPTEAMMVTANKTFGDIEAAKSLGMKTGLIRHQDGFANLLQLAESHGSIFYE
jgi:FMN phosphatase YigB (HAD superfamily)